MAGYPLQTYSFWGKLKVHLALFLFTFGYSVYQILSKIGFGRGISEVVYPFYRNVIGFFVVAVLAYFSKKKVRAHLTAGVLVQFFFLGLIGISLNQSLYLLGIVLTNPTIGSAFLNSTPTIVFLMAAASGWEEVHLNRRDGKAKVTGAALGVAGVIVMTTIKGQTLHLHNVGFVTEGNTFELGLRLREYLVSSNTISLLGFQIPTWQLGSLALLGACICMASWILLQLPVLRTYPDRLSMVAFVELFASIQLFAFALWQEPDFSRWKISGSYNLIIVLYAGLIGSGMSFTLQTWCVQQAGPVVTAAYEPLQSVLVGLLSIPILGSDLSWGNIGGAVLIVCGLYLLVWGQAEERRLSEGSLPEGGTKGRSEEVSWKIDVGQDPMKEPLLLD